MVDLKILTRLVVELQYRREGLWRQLLVMVVLKSGGGCRLFRSSTTVAVSVQVTEIAAMAIENWIHRFFEAMAKFEAENRQNLDLLPDKNIQTV